MTVSSYPERRPALGPFGAVVGRGHGADECLTAVVCVNTFFGGAGLRGRDVYERSAAGRDAVMAP